MTVVGHSILIKTSNTYNEFLDNRAYTKLVKSLTKSEIERFQIYSNNEELNLADFHQLIVPELFKNMEYSRSMWNSPDYKWTHRVRVENRVLLGGDKLRYDAKVFLYNGSDVFSVYYNKRFFCVNLPHLKEFIDHVVNKGG